MKTTLLKILFWTVTSLIGVTLIGLINYLLVYKKYVMLDYMMDFYLFCLQFFGMGILFGGCTWGLMFLSGKLYNKLFTKK